MPGEEAGMTEGAGRIEGLGIGRGISPCGAGRRGARKPGLACWLVWAAGALLALTATPVRAVTDPLPVSATRIASGLAEPMYATAPAGDPRLFILERNGTIRVLQNGSVLSTPFLDISSEVETRESVGGEGGLLGMVFAPDYATSGVFYVYYTAPDPTATQSGIKSRVSRFTVSGDPATSNVADPGSEQVLFELQQPYDNHNGGTLGIRGGYLYLGLGDGGSGGDPQDRAQNDAVLFGKMIRLDLSKSNPSTGDWQIWDKGFRNPFRWSFDAMTEDLYIGDVGQSSMEEVDVEPSDSAGGLNYGWHIMEGTNCYASPAPGEPACNDPSLVLPIYEYTHVDGNCAIIGGSVYRGNLYLPLRGSYFFTDLCRSNLLWSLVWDGAGGTVGPVLTHTVVPDHGSFSSIVAITQDGTGELDAVSQGGDVFRLVPEPASGVSVLTAAGALLALARRRGRRLEPAR
jgi:glucose/arabinose dehydrogenase